jgi:hypothetical protein
VYDHEVPRYYCAGTCTFQGNERERIVCIVLSISIS